MSAALAHRGRGARRVGTAGTHPGAVPAPCTARLLPELAGATQQAPSGPWWWAEQAVARHRQDRCAAVDDGRDETVASSDQTGGGRQLGTVRTGWVPSHSSAPRDTSDSRLSKRAFRWTSSVISPIDERVSR